MLIGADYPKLHLYSDSRSRNPHEPVALRTQLGLVLMGGRSNEFKKHLHANKICVKPNIEVMVEKFWQIESFGTVNEKICPTITRDDQRAYEILKETTKWENNRYTVGLLWKNDSEDLPNNRSIAILDS